MTKTWYQLCFKQLQPLHLGIASHGVVAETRLFITGRAMWGSLTNTYCRNQNKKFTEENKKLFEAVTCFFPSIKNGSILFSEYKKGGLYMGNYPEKEFRYKFVDTFVSTAINPDTLTAKDESLHETNMLLPKSKDKKEQLFWHGVLGLTDEEAKKFINAKPKLYIGGEQNRGFGLVELAEAKQISNQELNAWNLDQQGNYIYNDEKVLKHFLAVQEGLEYTGEAELDVEIDFQTGHTKKKFLIAPGSIIQNVGNRKLAKGFF